MPRTAVVTGGAKRLGRAIVERLADDGYAVAIHCNRSGAQAEALARDVVERGGAACVVQGDLSDERQVRPLMTEAEKALGPVGVLVNNASAFIKDDAATPERTYWDIHMEIHVRSPFVLAQELAARLPREANGVVINMIDHRVFNPQPYFMSYGISKYALWGMTQMLARALAPRVRVNGIGPGPTLKSPRQSIREFEDQWRAMPLKRPVPVEEIAAAVRFILDASSMTGQMVALDSGQHMCWSPAVSDENIAE